MAIHLVTGYAGREHISAADVGAFHLASLSSENVVFNKGNKFKGTVINNNKVRILDGEMLLQGRHIRISENTFEDVVIQNGTQGMKRIDLIVMRYEKNSVTGIETSSLKVLRGSEAISNPQPPTHQQGDITQRSNGTVADFPLYKVHLESIALRSLEPVFTILNPLLHKVDKEKITSDKTITEEGYVVDARQLNANVSGSLASTIERLGTAFLQQGATIQNLIQMSTTSGWTIARFGGFKIAFKNVAVSPTLETTVNSISIFKSNQNLPTGVFTTEPNVFVNVDQQGTGGYIIGSNATWITGTSFTVYFGKPSNSSNGAVDIKMLAIGV